MIILDIYICICIIKHIYNIYIYISIIIIINIYIYIYNYNYKYIYIDIMYFPFLATFGIIPPDHNSTFFFFGGVGCSPQERLEQDDAAHLSHLHSIELSKIALQSGRHPSVLGSLQWWAKIHGLQLPAAWDWFQTFRSTHPKCVSSGSYPILS
jgi:hypothetical protein